MRHTLLYLLIGVICSFTISFTTPKERIIDLKVPSYTFTDWLEYEVWTLGEQDILVTIKNQAGKVFHKKSSTLYGESYLEMDASEFPKGIYTITVICKTIEVMVKTEKI